jgi:hypothetical protein
MGAFAVADDQLFPMIPLPVDQPSQIIFPYSILAFQKHVDGGLGCLLHFPLYPGAVGLARYFDHLKLPIKLTGVWSKVR